MWRPFAWGQTISNSKQLNGCFTQKLSSSFILMSFWYSFDFKSSGENKWRLSHFPYQIEHAVKSKTCTPHDSLPIIKSYDSFVWRSKLCCPVLKLSDLIWETATAVQKFGGQYIFSCFYIKKNISTVHQGCIYKIINISKTVILWNIITS